MCDHHRLAQIAAEFAFVTFLPTILKTPTLKAPTLKAWGQVP